MNYDNKNVRRQDRLLEELDAARLLREGEYGVLSMVENINERDCAENLGGYGVPLNYVWDEEKNSIYFHCAPEGRKLECISKNPRASFCVVGKTKVVSSKFSTAYESVLVRGTARADLTSDERMKALELILKKYSPLDIELGKKYAQNSFARTQIIRLDILESSGKTKRIKA